MDSICVYCGSSDDIHPDYKQTGRLLGRALAENGIRLIFGGGKTGIMGAVADGALEAGGEVIGVMICMAGTPENLLACMKNHQPPRDAVRRWMRQQP